MSIREVMESFPYEEIRQDNRNFCNECGRITESIEGACKICGSKREKETLLEKIMSKEGMNEFGKAYPDNPQIISFLEDHWDEFLDANDAIAQVGKTFGVSEEDARNVISAVEAELGKIVPVEAEVYASRTGRELTSLQKRVSKKNEEVDTGIWIVTAKTEDGVREEEIAVIGGYAEAKEKANNLLNANYTDWEILKIEQKGKENESDEEGDFETLGSGMDKEDADKLAREKQGTVVKDEDDESDEDKYSVIKKKEEKV